MKDAATNVLNIGHGPESIGRRYKRGAGHRKLYRPIFGGKQFEKANAV